MKIKKTHLEALVVEAIYEELSAGTRKSDRRLKQLDRFKIEASVSYLELLEDILEHLDKQTWNNVFMHLKEKYGYL